MTFWRRLIIVSIPVLLLVGLIGLSFVLWRNYLECRTQFSTLYCATTHLLR